MNYLAAEEYENYGIEASTPASWVGAASSLIDAHCRRPTLGVEQYVERKRLAHGTQHCLQLTYLPLSPARRWHRHGDATRRRDEAMI